MLKTAINDFKLEVLEQKAILFDKIFLRVVDNNLYQFPCNSCNNLPLTRWHKTTDVYSLAVLEARSPKPGCQQGHISPGDSPGEPFLACFSFWRPLAFHGLLDLSLHHCSLYLCYHIAFSSILPSLPYCLLQCVSPVRTFVISKCGNTHRFWELGCGYIF